MRTLIRQLFGVDLRSLAVFRMGIALAVLADVATRALDLTGLYTDAGVLPRDVLREIDGPAVQLSIHYWAGVSPLLQALVFAVTAACAVALLLGWRTWLATAACWYFVASIQIRQPLGYMGGDSILRMLLFWGLLLPLGARLSLDARQGRVMRRPDWLVSPVTASLLLQVALIYWVTGLRKVGPLWWSGDAVFVALHIDQWATPVGIWLREQRGLLRWITYATLAIEVGGPFLAFVPVYTAAFRIATILLFWGFHLGLATTMNIGLFPLFSMVAWLPFLPAVVWDRVGLAGRAGVSGPIGRVERLSAALACVVFLYIAISLAERTRLLPRILPRPVTAVATGLRLQQSWSMFAPDPRTRTGRYTLRRIERDGSVHEEPATDRFRWTVYMDRVGHAWPVAHPLSQSLRRFAAMQCATRPDGREPARVAVRVEWRAIRAEGYGPSSSETLADVACR